MSRIGIIPIDIPKDVKIKVENSSISVKGAKGELTLPVPPGIKVEEKENRLVVSRLNQTKQTRSNHGTIRARLAQNIVGVTQGHKRELELQGIGFRAQSQGKKITFSLGFSHPVEFEAPADITVSVPTQTTVTVEGIDNVVVGQTAAKIKALKPVEPYKGKGIRYAGEIIRRKQGKSVSK